MNQKPPLGVMPRKIWLEHRKDDLVIAVIRSIKAGHVPNTEWLDELECCVNSLVEQEGIREEAQKEDTLDTALSSNPIILQRDLKYWRNRAEVDELHIIELKALSKSNREAKEEGTQKEFERIIALLDFGSEANGRVCCDGRPLYGPELRALLEPK